MQIRRLSIADYEALVELWERAKLHYKARGRDSKEEIAAQMAANPQFFLGAFEGDRLVGAVVLSSDMRRGWINRLAVDPGFRRRGIAKALIAESERVLKEAGIKVFAVHIENWNTGSKELFRKCGYVEHRDVTYFSKRESNEV
ncbi:GNAT family N-acetyltransferase [Candidatus Bathyarchaeota archaeon]|nr:GNAT family N-acetyltransferase [Candidatus Bathyarchaeota archaeon]